MLKLLPRMSPPVRLLLVVVIVVVIPQLVIPRIAEQALRNRLEPAAKIESVKVEAFPAIELIWHHAQKVVVKLHSYRAPVGRIRSLLGEASGVTTLEATVGTLTSGALTLHNLSFAKRWRRITGSAELRLSDLRTALPILRSLTLVRAAGGTVELHGVASLLGVSAGTDVVLEAQHGAVVLAPSSALLGFAKLTVFSAPQLDIQRISGQSIPGGVRLQIAGVWR